ncbi:MAG: PleD family two-component system response regulator [Vicinamibacterales bacterium]
MSTPPTLLLADDSVTIQRVVALTFADQPVRLVVAKDGQDAINRMASDRPDVVLADTNMPCVDGYEVARWMRQQPHLSAVPVLLLAGATDPVDEQRLYDSGANGVLEKPFEPTHVISRVKELLGMKATAPAAPTGRLLTPPEPRPARVAPPGASRAAAEPPDPRRANAPLGDVLSVHDAPVASGDAVALLDSTVRDVPEAPDAKPTAEDAGWLADVTGGGAAATDNAAAEAFASLLAAEQGDPAAIEARRRGAVDEAQTSDGMVDALAAKVVERLQPAMHRDVLPRDLATVLRETVTRTVRDSVATEIRAAVAEAVQAAVDGSLIGTVRGALNEAVTSAVPPAVASAVAGSVGARVESAVQESVNRVLPAAVERAVQEFVQSRVTVLVRDTIEHEWRASVAPMLPEAVRSVVRETSERLVSEEIAKIRSRRAT